MERVHLKFPGSQTGIRHARFADETAFLIHTQTEEPEVPVAARGGERRFCVVVDTRVPNDQAAQEQHVIFLNHPQAMRTTIWETHEQIAALDLNVTGAGKAMPLGGVSIHVGDRHETLKAAGPAQADGARIRRQRESHEG